MTYPLEFRKKVFAVKAKKRLTFEETSERFDVPMRTLFRWQKHLEPCVTRHKPATKIDMSALAKDVELNPDAYQWERAQRFSVTQTAIRFALKRLGVSYIKKPKTSASKRKRTYQLPNGNKHL